MQNLRKNCLLLISVMMISMFLLTSVAYAAEVDLEKLDVQVKPEYDKKQKVFLMFAGELKSTGSSAKTVLYMPNTIDEDDTLHICALDGSGEHECQLREKETEGNLFKMTTPMPRKTFQAEGYFEGIKDNNGNKTLDYTFKAGQNIKELKISLTHPKNATDYKTNPEAQSTGEDDNGLKNHIYTFNNVKKNKEYKFNVTYKKKGWDVSLERSGMGASASQASGSPNSGNVNAMTIIIALIVAITFVAIIFMIFTRKGQESNRPRKGPVPPKGKGRFCTNCGTRMQGNAKFCPNCGSKSK